MNWEIVLLDQVRDKQIETFIKLQQSQTQAKIIHTIRLLGEYGPRLGMPHAEQLGRGMYELRIRGKEEIRIFYCFWKNKIYLLHAFKKKTQKTPKKDIEIARKRMSELTNP